MYFLKNINEFVSLDNGHPMYLKHADLGNGHPMNTIRTPKKKRTLITITNN